MSEPPLGVNVPIAEIPDSFISTLLDGLMVFFNDADGARIVPGYG